jgi:hypothetical protein
VRSRVAAVVGAFCTLAPVFALGHVPSGVARDAAAAVITVSVLARCRAAGGADVTVTPDPVLLRPNDEAAWELDSAGTAEAMRVYPKDAAEWPYPDPPHRGRRGAPARAQRMKPGQAGRTFLYNVEVTCTRPNGRPDTVVFDPEMIVRKR